MDGYVTIGTKLDTNGVESGISGLKRSLETKMSGLERGITKIFKTMKATLIGVGLALVFKQITKNIDDAISRLDTLSNYTKVMSNLGISADDAQQSIDYLSEKLIGLPTTLNDAASAVQRFTSANGNIKASTEMFLALNNAILAGGATMEVQSSALEQLSQSYAKGKPDMMEWRTAMMAMPAQLKQVAQAMGYVSADALGEALRNGTVSMNEFMLTLIKLNKEGVNGFQSFEEQARNATGGIATSMANVKTAITRGLAQIMEAIGQSNIAGFFQGIASAINKTIPYIVAFVKVMVKAVSAIAGLFGHKTKEDIQDVTNSTNGASNSMGNLANNAQNTAGGLDKATGSAKKLNKELKNLQGFDEANVLQEASASTGGAGGTGGVGASGLGNLDLSGFETDIKKSANLAEELEKKLVSTFSTIGQLFQKGFVISYGDTNYEGIMGHIKSLKKSLVEIGTDPNVLSAGQKFVTAFWTALGQMVGSMARIGVNIAEGIIGGIDTYFQQNKQRVKKFFTDLFTISSEDLELTGAFYTALGEISDVFTSDDAKQIVANIISMFTNPLMSLITVFVKFIRDMKMVLMKPIIDNTKKIKKAIKNTFKPLAKVTETLSKAFTTIGDTINDVYDNHLKPFFDSFATGISNTLGKLLDVYNKYVAPALNRMAKSFDELWEKHLKGFVTEIGKFFGSIIDLGTTLWKKVLKPTIDWIIENVIPKLVPVMETIWNTTKRIIGNITDAITGIIKVLRGTIEFFNAVFQGDWDKAWEAVKTTVDGFFTAIKGLFGTVVDIVLTPFEIAWARIKAIWEVASTWFKDTVTDPIKTLFSNIWEKIKGWASGAWDNIKKTWNGVKKWFQDTVTNPIKTLFSKVWDKIKTGAGNVWDKVKKVFGSAGKFFGDLWTTIKTKFTNIGQKIGDAVGGAFKGAVNAVLRTLESTLNTPIRAINAMADTVNNMHLPGVYMNKLNEFKLPRLKTGGIINMPNKGTLLGSAIGGESGREGVIPLTDQQAMSELGREIGKNVLINLTNVTSMNGRVISRQLKQIRSEQDFAYNT